MMMQSSGRMNETVGRGKSFVGGEGGGGEREEKGDGVDGASSATHGVDVCYCVVLIMTAAEEKEIEREKGEGRRGQAIKPKQKPRFSRCSHACALRLNDNGIPDAIMYRVLLAALKSLAIIHTRRVSAKGFESGEERSDVGIGVN